MHYEKYAYDAGFSQRQISIQQGYCYAVDKQYKGRWSMGLFNKYIQLKMFRSCKRETTIYCQTTNMIAIHVLSEKIGLKNYCTHAYVCVSYRTTF